MEKHYPRKQIAFPALIAANLFLAAGPWMVRTADTGAVATGFWRLLLAEPPLLLISRMGSRKKISLNRALILTILIGGMLFAADLAAWNMAILRTKLANATLFGNVSALLFPVYGFIIARALPKGVQAVALVLAIIGSALLLGSSYEVSTDHFRGDLLAILAGIFYTLYLVAIDQARRTLAPMPLLALCSIAGSLPLLVLALAMGEKVIPTDWTPLIILAISSQVIGQGLLVYAIGHLSPLVVGLALLSQPIVTAAIGWIVYDERLSPVDYVGAALICVALVLIRLPEHRSRVAS